jgi:hypothetical protein
MSKALDGSQVKDYCTKFVETFSRPGSSDVEFNDLISKLNYEVDFSDTPCLLWRCFFEVFYGDV